jgi:hypothetical protein
MTRAQGILLASFAASFYNVGTIWMTQFGWRLWPYVAPNDFEKYHLAWWTMIKPVIFPVAAVAFFGSIAMLWLRPAGVSATAVWLNFGLQIVTYATTAAFWARWQAKTHFAVMPDGSLDPMYALTMNTHWIRAAIITLNGLVIFWMLVEHLSHGMAPSSL